MQNVRQIFSLIIKTIEMHYFSNLFWYRTLHVTDMITVITVMRAPDDGCQHPKHVELPTEI